MRGLNVRHTFVLNAGICSRGDPSLGTRIEVPPIRAIHPALHVSQLMVSGPMHPQVSLSKLWPAVHLGFRHWQGTHRGHVLRDAPTGQSEDEGGSESQFGL